MNSWNHLVSRRETLRLRENIDQPQALYEKGGIAAINIFYNSTRYRKRVPVSNLEERSRVIGAVASRLNQIDRQMIQIGAELVGLQETMSYHCTLRLRVNF